MSENTSVWIEVLSNLKNSISPSEFQTWITPISFREFKNNTVILSVSSAFYKNKIDSLYKSMIEREFDNVGIPANVEIILDSSYKPNDDVNTLISLQQNKINSILNKKTAQNTKSETDNEEKENSADNSISNTTPHINDVNKQNFERSSALGDSNILQQNNLKNNNTATDKNKINFEPNPTLNQSYTFDSFVPGDNSYLVYSACTAIAKNPGSAYNPCLIYGGVGLGKTHLIQSIGNAVYNNNHKLKVLYTTTENFMNDFYESIQNDSMNEFRKKYRKVSVLLIDDIQFLSGKAKIQEELFNTFNDLYDSGRQLVFTCDRPVEELKDITDRLKTRFIRGFCADIQPPNYETRVAIIKKKCKSQNLALDNDVIDFIATNIVSNVRMIESCITKLKAYSDLINENITLENAKQLLKDNIYYSTDTSGIKIDTIIKAVANFYNIDESLIKSKGRSPSVVQARQVAMYICTKLLGENTSSTEIARVFGKKNHSTVLYSIKEVEKKLITSNNSSDSTGDNSLAISIQKLTEQIKSESYK